MNKKAHRSNVRAPTVQPVVSITPSATLAQDGDAPLAASHDVLHAALAPTPRQADVANDATGTPAAGAANEPDAAPATDPAIDGAADVAIDPAPVSAPLPADAAAAPKKKAGKQAKKPAADATVDVPAKVAREKFVKIGFSLPESEAGLLDALKKTHQGNGVALKKSQLLRAGLLALADLDSTHIAKLVAHLPAAPTAGKKKK